MNISIIIPTYNRKASLCSLLSSLAQQTLPATKFDVVVIDDGSSDDTSSIGLQNFPFKLHYIWQENQGDATARNTGVNSTQAELLVFLDDDMLVHPDYLAHLVAAHASHPNQIVVGTEYLVTKRGIGIDQLEWPSVALTELDSTTVVHPFVDVFSRNMSIPSEVYKSIGLMSNLGFSGSSIWCDVEFSYRAHMHGIKFRRSTSALCYHCDYVAQNLDNAKRRSWEAGRRSVVLFQRYPELASFLPMFYDKMPINWHGDHASLVLRKLMRHIASTDLPMLGLEQLMKISQQHEWPSAIQKKLYIWICGGYIYRGLQEGLNAFGPIIKNIDSDTVLAK
jgi:glycosyltransferase involved in cell wall biosynthesis